MHKAFKTNYTSSPTHTKGDRKDIKKIQFVEIKNTYTHSHTHTNLTVLLNVSALCNLVPTKVTKVKKEFLVSTQMGWL